jgi:hypothetical protein
MKENLGSHMRSDLTQKRHTGPRDELSEEYEDRWSTQYPRADLRQFVAIQRRGVDCPVRFRINAIVRAARCFI